MSVKKPSTLACPYCLHVPKIGYSCGDYFVIGDSSCDCCSDYHEMHASFDGEVSAWNDYASRLNDFLLRFAVMYFKQLQ